MTMTVAATAPPTDMAYVAVAAFDYLVAPLACAVAIRLVYGALDPDAPARRTAILSRLPAVLVAKVLLEPPLFLLGLASWGPRPSSVGAAGSAAMTCERVTLLAGVARDNVLVLAVTLLACGYLLLRFTFLYQAIVVDGAGPVHAFRRSWQVSAWRSMPIFGVRIVLLGTAVRIVALAVGSQALATAIVSPLDAAVMTAAYLQLRGGSIAPAAAPIASLATAS
jgi:hypothetical protein